MKLPSISSCEFCRRFSPDPVRFVEPALVMFATTPSTEEMLTSASPHYATHQSIVHDDSAVGQGGSFLEPHFDIGDQKYPYYGQYFRLLEIVWTLFSKLRYCIDRTAMPCRLLPSGNGDTDGWICANHYGTRSKTVTHCPQIEMDMDHHLHCKRFALGSP